jgi:high affinity sulfate transporter 1
MKGYRRSWLSGDLVAGATLAAVAIPEVMGYTSIAQTPIVTGLYTVIFPAMIFALLGSSRLLVVGADSATAALLAAGLTAAAINGVTPGSQEWLAYTSFVALLCAGLLIIARVLRLGFLGDFLSSSVLIGFLTGVGVQVFTGQIPDMLGVPKGSGNWFQQQWSTITSIPDSNWVTVGFALGTLALIFGFKRFAPRVPGAIIAVVLSIIVSAAISASSAYGVVVVGSVQGGFPPLGLPQGISMSNFGAMLGIAFSCFVLIIAQSAATSRSFAAKHGQSVDVNRDIVGLSGANAAAGLSGTFVVNGSPTKTQILDESKGRTQLANLTMSLIVLVFTLFLTGLLTDMPKSVLGAIVFVIGLDLVDVAGMRLLHREARIEFWIALITAVVVCAVGVEQGIILAIVVSILEIIRRQYSPRKFVIGVARDGEPAYQTAEPGTQSAPGLIIFRYDAELFYANANRFVDDVQRLVEAAPDPVEWLVLDAGSIDTIDYSAAMALQGLVDYLKARGITPVLAHVDPSLLTALQTFGIDRSVPPEHMFGNLGDAVAAFGARQRAT